MHANYRLSTPTEFSDFDKSHVWHPFTSLVEGEAPILIQSADGVWLTASDGRRILDAVSSWWVNIHGHSNKRIADAIYKQATTLEHVIFAGFTHEPAINLARNLLTILPKNQTRIFYSDNGSTAVEVALKMAMQYWYNVGIPKRKILALEGAYHGDTFGAMSVGERGLFTKPFDPWLFDVQFIPVPNDDNIEEVAELFEDVMASEDVAAFIFEPLVQGAAGMVMYKPEHLDVLLSIAKRHDVVTIADEVFTGFGRTGTLFACHQLSNEPEIMAVSKGITGGTLPLGVTSCSKRIEGAFLKSGRENTFFHGHSYTANPIACAAANASYSILVEQDCSNAIRQISEMQAGFAQRIRGHARVKESRSCGTILRVEIATGQGTSYFNELRQRIYHYFVQRNILLRPLGNVIYVVPPYVIHADELEMIHQAIEEFLGTLPD